MEIFMFVIFVFLFCVDNCHGNVSALSKFLQVFDFQHLDSLNIDSMEIELADQSSDETLAAFTEDFEKLKIPTSFQKKDKCVRPVLKVVQIDSILALNNTECQIKGQFIKNTCQSYLIYAFQNTLLDDHFILKLKCNLIFQPIVHILMKTQYQTYDLFEIHVFSNRYIHLAYWNIIENIIRNHDVYERRKDLTGIQLKIERKPINVLTQRKHMIHNEILASFREEFNFTIDWLPYSGSYGTYDPMNKSWNGMMKELIEHETDLGPYDFTQIACRNMFASPGLTLMKTYKQVYFWKTPNLSPGWFSMLKTFSTDFWMLSMAATIIIFLLLHLTQLMEPKYKKKHSIYVLIAITKAFLSQSFDEQTIHSKQQSWASSFLIFTLSMMGFFVFAAYTSCLTSILAANTVNIPFTTLDELARYSDFKLYSFGGGASETWLKLRSLESKEIETAYNKNILPYIGMGNSHLQIWIASHYEDRTGFITSESYIEDLQDEDVLGEVNLCDFLIVPLRDFKPVPSGWMYPKNSLLQELFDKYMLELSQTGVIHRIENTFSLSNSKMCYEDAGFMQMGFDYVRLFFVLLAIGLFLALVIGIYEKFKTKL